MGKDSLKKKDGVKKFKILIVSLILGGMMIAVTIKFLNHHINVDLTKVNQISGCVIDAGIRQKTSGNRIKIKDNVFFIILNNSSEVFATYRPEQEYATLTERIKIGDTITIYYRSHSGDLNLDVYQITEHGQVIQDYKSYNHNHRIIAWITGISGLGVLAVGFYPFFKRCTEKYPQTKNP